MTTRGLQIRHILHYLMLIQTILQQCLEAVGVAIAVWWTTQIIRKQWTMLRIKPLCGLSGTHKIVILEVVIDSESPVIKMF